MKNHTEATKITLIIVAGILILGILGYSAFMSLVPESGKNTINVNGQTSLKVMPDLVVVYFNIETNASKAEQAKDKNSEISDKLITELIKIGFERKEIQTQNYNIYPNYEWKEEKRTQKGYKASHSIKVEFSTDNSNQIGQVIDAGVNAGAEISHINFELSNELQSSYKAEAIKKAAQDAKIKAEALAQGLNKEVGKIISVSTNNYNYRPWLAYDSVGATSVAEIKSVATNIQPSEQEISAIITATYKLK